MKEQKFKVGDKIVCIDEWTESTFVGIIKELREYPDYYEVEIPGRKHTLVSHEDEMRHLTPLEEVLN